MTQQTDTGLIERISNEYYNLTAAEKKAADFVVSHRTETQKMSITDLAEKSEVAEATLSRFVRRLGYRGFSDFKMELAKSLASSEQEFSPLSGEVHDKDSFSDVCRKLYAADEDAITQTLKLVDEESIRKAADYIEAADKVICMGQGGSMIIAEEAAHIFTTIGSKYFSIGDNHTQAIVSATMSERDVILYFSYSGATRDMMQTLSVARARGVKIILVTHYPNSPGVQFADVILLCGAKESPLQLGSIPAKISQLFLMDVLFSEVARRNLDECRHARSQIANALAEKHL
ncbi:MAG: MurR/RpiR family transcriptional regulator [Eubacteriales bacterium]|nr:MurR/RpiR family transcriptional regulator [Eubacteriales bacterium]